jgi:hypothetical protein
MISGLSESLTLTLVLLLIFGSVCLYLYTRITHTEQKISLIESILLDLKMASDLRSFDRGSDDDDDDGHGFSSGLVGGGGIGSSSGAGTGLTNANLPTQSSPNSNDIDAEYNEYKDVLETARAARTDNLSPVDLDGGDLPQTEDVAELSGVVVAAGSPAAVDSPTTTEVTAEVATDAVSSVTGAAPFEVAESIPFESLSTNTGSSSQTTVRPNLEAMTVKELHALAKQRSIVGESKKTRAQLIEELSSH